MSLAHISKLLAAALNRDPGGAVDRGRHLVECEFLLVSVLKLMIKTKETKISCFMSAKFVAFSAIVASAAAFAPGASFQPRLRSAGVSSISMDLDRSSRAPVITVFDHRGCVRGKKDLEYTGKKSGDANDEMCVKVDFAKININTAAAAQVTAETLGVLTK